MDCRGGVGCPRLAQSPGHVHPCMSIFRFQTQASRTRNSLHQSQFQEAGLSALQQSGGREGPHGLRGASEGCVHGHLKGLTELERLSAQLPMTITRKTEFGLEGYLV